ncbi:MAG: histidinol-phosphate transaminase [Acidobacteria bacterium]|nr:histidinol-phosphate transaminase [Acidobacteriota bacterium]
MSPSRLSRRHFAQVLGGTLGAWALASRATQAGAWAVPAAQRHANLPAGAVRIDSNENPYGPSPKALEAMSRSQRISARYPDALEDEVTAALAALHHVDPDQVILGCGSGEVLRMADMAFLSPGKNVVVAEPTFEAVLAFARVTRADPIKVPLTSDYRHDLVRMAAACNSATGLVYLCNPNNPTGTIVRKDEMVTFFQRVPKETVILVDEAYFHFVEDERYASAFEWMEKYPNLLVVRTFSKIYGLAGMRLGYGAGSKEFISAMRPHRIWSNANAAVLEAALASLADTGNVARCRRAMNATRRALRAEMEKDRHATIPSEANFVMINVGSDVEPIIAALRERYVLVGRKFPSLPTWLRVSMGTPEEMQQFVAALREVVPPRPVRARLL